MGEMVCQSNGFYSNCDAKFPESDHEVSCLDGRDEDCDGLTDCADLDCKYTVECNCDDVQVGSTEVCSDISDVGVCGYVDRECIVDEFGRQTWGACSGEGYVPGQKEICGNGLDDDCDNETDEIGYDGKDCVLDRFRD